MKPSEQLDHADSTLNKLDELLQPLTVNIVGQSTSSVDVRKIMDEGKILLVKLSAQLDSVTSLIGSVLIALFLNAAYARPANKRRQFNLYADEFQRFSTDDFATLLTEARKFGIATTIAHQARYQPGMTDGIRATSLSAKNLVVFKVNSKDADELAGEFDITPQEAWEEVLEEEWVEIVKPQWHERIEEQVEVEVEEDIEEITQNPLEYLKSARGTHIHAKVRSSMLAILPQLRIDHTIPPQYRNEKTPDNLLFINTLLVDVMEHRLAVQTEEFAERVAEFVIVAAMDIGWMSRFSYAGLKLHRYSPSQSSAVKNFRELLSRCIYEYVSVTIDEKRLSEELACLTQELKGIEPLEIAQLSSFITNLIVLCKGLAEEPLRVPTGKKRLVKRIEPRITYLTHESEKITHPRKTIMHPQRTYADMHNEVAAQLVNLGNFLARIRYINADQRNVECAIRTLDPKQDADTRPLFVSALEERIACIKARNMQDGYLRKRMDVEAEIRQRQELCCEPPDEPSDTIYRRPKH